VKLDKERVLVVSLLLIAASAAGCCCGQSGSKDSPGRSPGSRRLADPTGALVTYTGVQLLPLDRNIKVTLDTVLEVKDKDVAQEDRHYWIMLGPVVNDGNNLGAGTIPSNDANEPMNNSVFRLDTGYAYFAGFWPLGHTVRVRACGEGCAFILQIEGNVHRAIFVDHLLPKETLVVAVWKNNKWDATNITPLDTPGKFYEVDANYAITGPFDVAGKQDVLDFVTAVTQKAKTAGLPRK
jgi:hypothetical protein